MLGSKSNVSVDELPWTIHVPLRMNCTGFGDPFLQCHHQVKIVICPILLFRTRIPNSKCYHASMLNQDVQYGQYLLNIACKQHCVYEHGHILALAFKVVRV